MQIALKKPLNRRNRHIYIPILHKAMGYKALRKAHKVLHTLQDHTLDQCWRKLRGPSFAPYVHRVVGRWHRQQGRRERKEPGINTRIICRILAFRY